MMSVTHVSKALFNIELYNVNMPRVHSLEKLGTSKRRDLRDALAGKGIKPRLAFVWPLSKDRVTALEVLKSKNPDPKTILKLLKHDDFAVRAGAIDALRHVDLRPTEKRKALSLLFNKEVLRPGYVQLVDAGDAIDNIILNMSKEEDFPLLEKLARRSIAGFDIKPIVCSALVHHGEKALPVLERMASSRRYVTKLLAEKTIAKIRSGEEGPMNVRTPRFEGWKSPYGKLITTRKVLFATPHTEDMVKRLGEVQEVSNGLRKDFGESYLGVSIYGSTASGYSGPKKDVDGVIFANKPEVAQEFLKRASKFGRTLDFYYVNTAKPSKMYRLLGPSKLEGVRHPKPYARMFRGLFFGNHEELRKLQEKTFRKIGKTGWDKFRAGLVSGDYFFTNYELLGIPSSVGVRGRLRASALVLQALPTYEEMREHLGIAKKSRRPKKKLSKT